MLKLAAITLALSACATHNAAFDRGMPDATGARSGIHLDLTSATDAANPAFPDVLDRAVPNIDRMAHAIRARLGTIAVAQLQLCVSPDGKVAEAKVKQGSGYAVFDTALEQDAAAWQFAAMPGRSVATVKSCRLTTVAYHAR